MDQLWRSFITDARSSYRLYSQDVDAERRTGVSQTKHFFQIAGQFFWAILEKLSPPRRVLLLVAIALIVFPGGEATWEGSAGNVHYSLNTHFYGGLLMFILLVLEVGDRVVMKRDLQIAKEIQTWLLPADPPVVSGLEIAFATRPANTVAGDYYDVFPRHAEGRETFVFAMADVAGKSIPAALLMATIQASLKTLAASPGSLADIVGRMNQYACSNSQNGRRFTTAFLGEYDPATNSLMYVNAGHNPPVLRRKSGSIEKLTEGGIPLGILEAAVYGAASVKLESGDYLAVFTDGVVEAENGRGEEYTEQRLLYMLHMGCELPPVQLLQNLIVDVDRFVAGAPQHDDITCMLVKAN